MPTTVYVKHFDSVKAFDEFLDESRDDYDVVRMYRASKGEYTRKYGCPTPINMTWPGGKFVFWFIDQDTSDGKSDHVGGGIGYVEVEDGIVAYLVTGPHPDGWTKSMLITRSSPAWKYEWAIAGPDIGWIDDLMMYVAPRVAFLRKDRITNWR
jgi:hypothetical protein